MKKLFYISILFLMSSCSNEFLNLYPETSLNESNFYKSDEEFISLINGSYIALRDLSRTVLWDVSEVKSDNMEPQLSNTNIEQSRNENFLMNSSSIVHKSLWDNAYKGIYNSNKALNAIEEKGYTWTNEQLKNRSLGEVYFLRGLYYFELGRQFGGVPLVLKEINSKEAVNITRSPIQDVYTQVIADLSSAIEHLGNSEEVHENGRASLTAAQGLLARVYLTQKNYTQAEVLLNTIIKSGKHGLFANYAEVFNPGKKDFYETLFSVQFSESAAELANSFIFFNAPSSSKGEVTGRANVAVQMQTAIQPTEDLINAFDQKDNRFKTAIGKWTGSNEKGGVEDYFYCAKYKGPQTAILGWSGDNFPILRYSDILLMYAEVLNELNRTSEALSYVKIVRDRAGLTEDLVGLSKTDLSLLIEKERRLEFCFENQRWYDLLRTDRAMEVLTAHGKEIKKDHLLAPIPGDQVLINNLEQNPGY